MSPSDPTPEKREVNLAWVQKNWVWMVLYGAIAAYVIAGKFSDSANLAWRIKIAVAVLWAILFVNVFTNTAEPAPTDTQSEEEKRNALERRSAQRRYWMMFAYGTMLLSLLIPVYLLSAGWPDVESKLSPDHPIAVFVGCADQDQGELNCFAPASSPAGVAGGSPSASSPAASAPAASTGARKEVKAGLAPALKPTTKSVTNSAWVINLGGHVANDEACKEHSEVCQVRGGLLIPLYVVLIALVGGSISMTRRLPEYQKLANPEHVPVADRPKLSQHEFREFLVFQIVQLLSAPLLAVVAYYLVEPQGVKASVVLAFIAGFSSESILMMVRALANKITPRPEAPKYGTISGIVMSRDAAGKEAPVPKAEVAQEGSTVVRTVTDDDGCYLLENVPLGEHTINVSSSSGKASGAVKVEQAERVVRKRWVVTK